MDHDELRGIEKPATLPCKGCDIGSFLCENKKVFGISLLCSSESGITVVYNGHHEKVTSRFRAHFALNNNNTGALGINHYPLSKKKWIVRYFSSPCFTDELCASEKLRIIR